MRAIDLHNMIDVRHAISPQVATNNTALVSAIIDRQGFDALEFAIATGTLADADATFTALVEDGDDPALGDNGAVAAADLLGTEAGASFTFADDDKAFKIGYRGNKRYVRLTITPANNTGNAPISALAILGGPKLAPV
ncbi:MAG: hypothetical protein ACHQ2F_03270 [Desulfobaccales bacterium]